MNNALKKKCSAVMPGENAAGTTTLPLLIDPFHTCKASVPARQFAQLMAT